MGYLKGIIIDLRRKGQKGFTLVELLVVISIIGILATLVLLQLGSARAKARDTQRITAVSQVRSALELSMDDNPTVSIAFATFNALCTSLKPAYVSACPTLTGMSYGYNDTTKKYQVAADLEATTKPSAMNADSDIPALGLTGGVDGGAETCAAVAADCYYDQGN